MASARRVTVTARARLGLGLSVLALASCRNIDRFNTEKPAAYCGSIVGGPVFESGFIADGAPPVLELRLEIDTSSLADRPGSLTSSDADAGFCKPVPLFSEAPLRAIPELLHDALSQADLGPGHEHDFFAWVDSSCEGTMLAVVSLLTNGAVEVRLLKPGPDPLSLPKADQDKGSGFALFYLQRSQTGCGF